MLKTAVRHARSPLRAPSNTRHTLKHRVQIIITTQDACAFMAGTFCLRMPRGAFFLQQLLKFL